MTLLFHYQNIEVMLQAVVSGQLYTVPSPDMHLSETTEGALALFWDTTYELVDIIAAPGEWRVV